MEPTRLLPIIVLFSLVAVEYGGWALLGFLTGRGALGAFREQFFRPATRMPGCCWCCRWSTSSTWNGPATRGHAGWLAGLLLLVGVLAQSGGFFVHLGIGQAGRRSAGTVLTRTGALIAAARCCWPSG